MKLLSVDIETTGLDWRRDQITCVGMWDGAQFEVYRDLDKVTQAFQTARARGYKFVGHNFKFDLKFLMFNGVDIRWEDWGADTYLLALANPSKIDKKWLEQYEAKRQELNKALPPGSSPHRDASHHSLKTLAPYHLGVPSFWEDPNDHDNDDYVYKDCKYTLDLYYKLLQVGPKEAARFASEKLLPWTKMLAKAEMRGVMIDLPLLAQLKEKAGLDAAEAKRLLEQEWGAHTAAWERLEQQKVEKDYEVKCKAAINKLKDKTKAPKTRERYQANKQKALSRLERFNYDSPTQLKWLLKTRLQLEVNRLDTGEESTGASVLENLSQEGVKGARYLLDYRKARKLSTAFFPSYEEMQHDSIIYTNFNIGGTRTGRLSSSKPNLQQVPGELHRLFIARPGHKLLTFDESAIEARLIAYLTEDPILTSICIDNHSIHDYNTKYIFFPEQCADISIEEIKKKVPELRKVSKTVGFALFYGARSKRIHYAARQAGLEWSEDYCQQVFEQFKLNYETVFLVKQQIDAAFSSRPFLLNSLGRPLQVEPKDIYMTGFNTCIQSAASDLVLQAATEAQEEFERRKIAAHVLLLIHDEIVVEAHQSVVKEAQEILTRHMTPPLFDEIQLVAEGSVNDFWDKG